MNITEKMLKRFIIAFASAELLLLGIEWVSLMVLAFHGVRAVIKLLKKAERAGAFK